MRLRQQCGGAFVSRVQTSMPDAENPKEAYGQAKACLHKVPMQPMLAVAEVMKIGAAKYGVKNWRVQPINASTYYSAMYRHMIQWYEGGEDQDAESLQHHLAHVVACALLVMDSINHQTLVDDRAFCEALTSKNKTPGG